MSKLNIRGPRFIPSSFTSLLNENQIPVNTSHVTGRPDEPSSKQRNIAHSAAEIEHVHPRLNSGREEELPGPLFEKPCL